MSPAADGPVTDSDSYLRLFEAAVMQSNESILITDSQLDPPGPRIVFTNPAFTTMTGYPAAEVLGKTPRILQGKGTDREVLQRIRDVLTSGNTFEGEALNYRKDGSEFVLEWKVAPIRDQSGRITHFIAVQRDVTKRRANEIAANRLAAIVAHSEDAIIGKDLEGVVNSWNRGAERIFGYSAEEMIGTSITRIIPEDRLQEEVEILDRIRRGLNVQHFETIRRAKDGRLISVSVTASPIRDPAGKIVGASKSARDITLRIANEKAHQAAEAQRIAFFDQAPDGILISDQSIRYIDANPSICGMLGYRREELIGMSAADVVLPEKVHAVTSAVATIRQREAYNQLWQFRRKDQSLFWADMTATLLPDGNVMALIRDITQRREAEEKIAEQAALLDKARDAIMVLGLSGTIIFWNKGAERIYGYSAAEAIGSHIGDLLGEAREKFHEVNGQTVAHGEWYGELHQKTKDRREIVIEARGTLIRDGLGQPKSILAINTEITERKKIEAQFLRAQRMESIGVLAGGIAHDLNNILAPIMMSIGMLRDSTQGAEGQAMLDTLELCAKRGSDIVRQVLSFARGVEGERAEIQPKHLLNDISGIIRDTFPRNIGLDFSVSPGTWTILGDPTQIHQVLMNLCVNARDALTQGGHLSLKAENREIDEHFAAMNGQVKPGRYVTITVTDDGTGIPPDILDKIFDPFFTTKDISKGTGLGLSTVMAIVKSHEGFINVYSEIGRGTTFKIYFLAANAAVGSAAGELEGEKVPRGSGETILVVDDEASVVSITGQTLQAYGYRVVTAIDGADAIAVFLQHRESVALIITDIMMPVMDGPAMIHAIRRVEPKVKIIASSGLSANSEMSKVAGAGVQEFLNKPYTARSLLWAVRLVLDAK